MKIIFSLALLALISAGIVAASFAQGKSVGKSFKGIELYSWHDSKGNFIFSLMPGTNRIKTATEIRKTENEISGVKALKQRLSQLAKGEQVFWIHDVPGFAYPDEKTLKAIKASAKKSGVELYVPPVGQRSAT
jgi:hypothetical protein